MDNTAELAASLRALHRPGDPLLLPNAWDAASARAVEAAGFPAVATSSAAVAAALGYEDGEDTPAAEMLAAVGRIAAAVSVPVTADLERGYGLPPAEFVERVAETGVVGCNLEDSVPGARTMLDVSAQADFLAAVRDAAGAAGFDLVVNARVDTYLRRRDAAPEEVLAEATARARAYLLAGADCAYPIGAADPEHLATLCREAGGPVNALLTPRSPDAATLARLGVARISMGGGLHHLATTHLSALLRGIATGHNPYAPAPPSS
jgi:2-methylisocitrate lyase-like PEP mutase family enzyme